MCSFPAKSLVCLLSQVCCSLFTGCNRVSAVSSFLIVRSSVCGLQDSADRHSKSQMASRSSHMFREDLRFHSFTSRAPTGYLYDSNTRSERCLSCGRRREQCHRRTCPIQEVSAFVAQTADAGNTNTQYINPCERMIKRLASAGYFFNRISGRIECFGCGRRLDQCHSSTCPREHLNVAQTTRHDATVDALELYTAFGVKLRQPYFPQN